MSVPADRDDKPRRLARFPAIVRERWWTVLLTIIVIAGLALGISLLLEPRYGATAQLSYSARGAQLASEALSSAGTAPLTHNISSDALPLRTYDFAGRVSKAMGGSPSGASLLSSVRVASNPALDLIEIRAVGSDPFEAAKIANACASEFVKERQEGTERLLAQAQSLVQARIDSLSANEAASARGIALKQQADDLALKLSMHLADYEVLQDAIVPTSAYFPRPLLNLLLGLAAGLILGLILVSTLNYLDRSIKDRATLERVMELPALGTMPLPTRRRGKGTSISSSAVGFAEGHEVLLESMRMLRSNLKVLGFGDSKRSVLITSATPGEAGPTLAVNLALSMTLSGDRVILVDADLRHPTIHSYLGIPNEQGLGDALMDDPASWSTKVQAVDVARFVSPQMSPAKKPASGDAPVSRFLCLTSGSLPGNPTEILESEAMTEVLGESQGISDYVILNGPPMLVASDSLILAQSVDAVVLASRLGTETAADLIQVKQLLARAEIPVLGLVICGPRQRSRGGYYFYRADHEGRAAVRKGA